MKYASRKYYGCYIIGQNHRLVESTDLLLDVYNGERHNGTVATVHYAQKAEREIIVLNLITWLITQEGLCGK